MPVHTYINWNRRETDQQEKIEPYRKYYFICEGANTEVFYFRKLIDIRKQLGIHSQIGIELLENTGADRDITYPKHLIEFADKLKLDPKIGFDKEHDKMVVVFDADIFEKRVSGYDDMVKEGEKSNILRVSNPAFELFLLLHIPNSWDDIIKPNLDYFFSEEDSGGKSSLCYRLLHDTTNMNSKKNQNIGNLAFSVNIAIEQEKNINEDIHHCKGVLTCNIGKIIQMIKDDN